MYSIYIYFCFFSVFYYIHDDVTPPWMTCKCSQFTNSLLIIQTLHTRLMKCLIPQMPLFLSTFDLFLISRSFLVSHAQFFFRVLKMRNVLGSPIASLLLASVWKLCPDKQNYKRDSWIQFKFVLGVIVFYPRPHPEGLKKIFFEDLC